MYKALVRFVDAKGKMRAPGDVIDENEYDKLGTDYYLRNAFIRKIEHQEEKQSESQKTLTLKKKAITSSSFENKKLGDSVGDSDA